MLRFLLLITIFCKYSETNIQVGTNSPNCEKPVRKFIQEHNPRIQEIFIFTNICEGIVNPTDSGLFGGFQGVLYFSECDKGIYINAREKSSHQHKQGSIIGIPGTLKGYESLYNMDICKKNKKKTPWKYILQPMIELAFNGWQINKELQYLYMDKTHIYHVINENNDFIKIKNPKLSLFLEIIRDEGPSSSLYKKNGNLLKHVLGDLQNKSLSSLTRYDFENYQVKILKSNTNLTFQGYKIYATKLPGNGISINFGLKVIDEANAYLNSIKKQSHRNLFLLYLLRSMTAIKNVRFFKFNYDEIYREANNTAKFIIKEIKILTKKYNNSATAEYFPMKIPTKIGKLSLKKAKKFKLDQFGTSNIVIKMNNSAISITSSINWTFGSGLFSHKFGLPYNNQLDDFSDITRSNRTPLSSMDPTIFVKNKKAVFAIGAAGGYKIMSATISPIFHVFVSKMNLSDAIDYPRCHLKLHQDVENFTIVCEQLKKSTKKLLNKYKIKIETNIQNSYSATTAFYNKQTVFDKRRGGSIINIL